MGLLILMSLNTIYSAGSTFPLPLLPFFFLINNLLYLDNVIPRKLRFIQKNVFFIIGNVAPVLEIECLLQFRFWCSVGLTYILRSKHFKTSDNITMLQWSLVLQTKKSTQVKLRKKLYFPARSWNSSQGCTPKYLICHIIKTTLPRADFVYKKL